MGCNVYPSRKNCRGCKYSANPARFDGGCTYFTGKDAIIAAMARKAINGDTNAARIVLEAQQATAEAAEPVKIIVDI